MKVGVLKIGAMWFGQMNHPLKMVKIQDKLECGKNHMKDMHGIA